MAKIGQFQQLAKFPDTFSVWLIAMRARRKEELPQAAKRIRISKETLEKLESGKKVDVKISTLRKIQKAYGGTMFNLFLMYDREFPE